MARSEARLRVDLVLNGHRRADVPFCASVRFQRFQAGDVALTDGTQGEINLLLMLRLGLLQLRRDFVRVDA